MTTESALWWFALIGGALTITALAILGLFMVWTIRILTRMPVATWCTFEEILKSGVPQWAAISILSVHNSLGVVGIRIAPATAEKLIESLMLCGLLEYEENAAFEDLSNEEIEEAIAKFDQDATIAFEEGYEWYYEYMLHRRPRRKIRPTLRRIKEFENPAPALA